MKKQGTTRLVTVIKMCLSSSGIPDKLRLLKSSGYRAYDKKIIIELGKWRYRPFLVNGRPVPVCTSVTLLYNQKS